MSYSVYDIARNQRGLDLGAVYDAQDRWQGNALALLAQQRALQEQDAFNTALTEYGPALGSPDGPTYQNALAGLVRSGRQGAGLVLPLLQQEREQAGFQALMGGIMGGGAPTTAAPMAAPTSGMPSPGAVAPPVRPRGNIQAINAQFDVERREAMQRYSGDELSRRLADISGRHQQAINGQGPNTTYRNPDGVDGVYRGVPAPQPGMPVLGTGGASASSPGGRTGLPTPDVVMRLMASGNPRAMEFARSVAPLVARESPNWTSVQADGNVYMVNPQNPGQRMLIGRANGETETVIVPDPASPTGFKYAPRQQAGASGLAAPAPEGYRPRNAPEGYRFGPPDANGNATLIPIEGGPASNQRSEQAQAGAGRLRTEFIGMQPVKDFLQIQPQYEAMERAANVNTAAADLDLIFGFAKMLDPTSVVREGEVDTIVKTGGVFDSLAGMVARVQGGARLSADVRTDLMRQARSRYTAQADSYDRQASRYRGLAERGGFSPDDVAVMAPRPQDRRSGTSAPGATTATGAPPQGATPPGAPPATPAPTPTPGTPEQRREPASITERPLPPRPSNGWTVRTLGSLGDDEVRRIAEAPRGLSQIEMAALVAELRRRNTRMGERG